MMKRYLVAILAAGLLLSILAPAPGLAAGRGGPMGFIAGCCFGIRAAADYNDGKEIHFREWGRIVPLVGLVFAIWDGVDGYSGKTRANFAAEYGSIFY